MFFCLLFGRGRGLRPNSKKNTTPPKQQKNKHAPAPSERVVFLLFGRVGVFVFLLFGPGACFFLLFGPGACFCFCCLGGGRVFFAVWARGVFLFLLFGRGACFFLLFGRWGVFLFLLFGRGVVFFSFFCCLGGNGNSLTYLSAWLVFKRPNNKKDQTANKNTVPSTHMPIELPLHPKKKLENLPTARFKILQSPSLLKCQHPHAKPSYLEAHIPSRYFSYTVMACKLR